MTMMREASNELKKPPMDTPDTKKSAIIMVQVLTINVNKPKVNILKGKVINNKSGFKRRLTRNNTNPISNNEEVSLMITVSLTMESK
jgi:hypothetical protein